MIEKKELIPLFNEKEIQEAIAEMGKKLNDFYDSNETLYVISLLKGGVMFTVDLVKHLNMPVKMEFVKISSYGSGFTSSGKVDALDLSLPDLNDKNVLIADDIVDTGHSAKFMLDYINQNYKVKSLKFCSLLNKEAKRAVDVHSDFYCFDVDDKFLVGYGLDYDGYCRNLPYIGYIEV